MSPRSRTKSQQARLNRNRGAQYEREVAKQVTQALGEMFKRRLGQAREGGHDLTSESFLIVECKRRKNPIAALKWLEQAEAACTEDHHVPLVITRGDDSPSVSVMYLHHLLPIIKKAMMWDAIYGDPDD